MSYSGYMNVYNRGVTGRGGANSANDIRAASSARNSYLLAADRMKSDEDYRNQVLAQRNKEFEQNKLNQDEIRGLNRDKLNVSQENRTEGIGLELLNKLYGTTEEQLAKVKPYGFSQLPPSMQPGSYAYSLTQPTARTSLMDNVTAGFGNSRSLVPGTGATSVRVASRAPNQAGASPFSFDDPKDPFNMYDPDVEMAKEEQMEEAERQKGLKSNIPSWIPQNLLSSGLFA